MFHVSKTDQVGTNRTPVVTHKLYDIALELALTFYMFGKDGEAFEITSAGELVWGPYIVGGKYSPADEFAPTTTTED